MFFISKVVLKTQILASLVGQFITGKTQFSKASVRSFERGVLLSNLKNLSLNQQLRQKAFLVLLLS